MEGFPIRSWVDIEVSRVVGPLSELWTLGLPMRVGDFEFLKIFLAVGTAEKVVVVL